MSSAVLVESKIWSGWVVLEKLLALLEAVPVGARPKGLALGCPLIKRIFLDCSDSTTRPVGRSMNLITVLYHWNISVVRRNLRFMWAATPFLSKGTQTHVIETRIIFIKYTRSHKVCIDTRGRRVNLKQALTYVGALGGAVNVLARGKEKSCLSISRVLVWRVTTNIL
jgi:hypothetical protein